MLPLPESNINNTALFLITSLSPTAAEAIDSESYRASVTSDEATDEHILDDAFSNLIKDINKIGITLNVDYKSISDDQETFFSFLSLASYLLPNSLYSILKTNQDIRTCVGHILDGSLGDDETVIQTYLSHLAGLDTDEDRAMVSESLVEFINGFYKYVSQDDSFTDYLKNLYQLVGNETLLPASDEITHERYRAIVKGIIVRLSDVINSVFADNPNYDALCLLQNQIIRDFISPDNYIDYSYLLLNKAEDLPTDLIDGYHRKWYHYSVSKPWCYDYYRVRKLSADDVARMMIYCFIYALHDTIDAFGIAADEVDRALKTHPSRDLVSALYQDMNHAS